MSKISTSSTIIAVSTICNLPERFRLLPYTQFLAARILRVCAHDPARRLLFLSRLTAEFTCFLTMPLTIVVTSRLSGKRLI